MGSGVRNRVILIIVCTVLAIVAFLPTALRGKMPQWWPVEPMKYGLDIKGGMYLVLGVQTQEAVKSQLTSMAGAIKAEMRKENIGLLRARQSGDREIEFSLLGERSVTPFETYMTDKHPELAQLSQSGSPDRKVYVYQLGLQRSQEIEKNAVKQAIETIRNRVDQYGVSEPTIQQVGEKQIIVQLPDVTNVDLVKRTIGSVAKLEFRLVADPSNTSAYSGSVRLKNRNGGESVLEDEVLMTGDAVESASVNPDPHSNQMEVVLKMTDFGATTFDRITGDHVGRQLAIVLDNSVQSAPTIRERISGGTAQITGSFTPDEAHRLAIVLRSGALPAPLDFLEQRIVGASLGADAIRKGMIASAVGSGIVILFMIGYYKKSGVLAVVCVILNVLMLLGCLALFGATLTLPGIAGLALTVGMAVDANVIIYERIREELRKGSGVRAAIEAGFEKAHWTILDSNLTTLLTGLILYAFGTGPIKGFAVTLSIGILTSMFAALVICHAGFQVLNLKKSDGTLSI